MTQDQIHQLEKELWDAYDAVRCRKKIVAESLTPIALCITCAHRGAL